MNRPDATTPLTDALAHHVGWPLAFTLLILAIAAAALLIAHALAALADKPEPVQTEYEAWARRDRSATVHYTDEPWAPTRAAELATVQQAEAYLADRPYNQEEEQ